MFYLIKDIWWFKHEYWKMVKRALAQRAECLLVKEEKTKEKTGKNKKTGGIDTSAWKSKSGRQWHGSLTCPS